MIYSHRQDFPSLILKHPDIIILKKGEQYQEPGFVATDQKIGDLTTKVKSSGSVNENKTGTYKIVYEVENQFPIFG